MTSILVNALAIVIVGFVLVRQGRDQRAREHPTARRLMIAALIPLGLQVGIYLLFGLGEMASGDVSGAGHLLPAVGTLALALLSWRRPIEGGAALLVVGIVSRADVSDATALLIMGAPQIVSGLLFLLAGWIAQRGTTPEAP